MPNRIRGDSELVVGNNRYTMRLTLGALAEIEDALGLSSLSNIATRLKTLATSDVAAVASALLRGGGHALSADDVLKFECDLGSIVRAIAGAFQSAGLSEGASGSSPAERGRGTTRSVVEGANAEDTGPLAGAASSNSRSG